MCYNYWWPHAAYLMIVGRQLMLGIFDVNGLATLASVSDREMPAWAAFSAWRTEIHIHVQMDKGAYAILLIN